MSGSALDSCAEVGKIRTTEPLRTWAQGAVAVGAHSMRVSAYTNIKSVCVCVAVKPRCLRLRLAGALTLSET